MKIQLDTENKTIKLESEVVLSKLVETLGKLLPNGEWKKFTLQTNTVIQNWGSPIVIHDHYPRPYWQPWYVGTTYYAKSNVTNNALSMKSMGNLSARSGNADLSLKSGVFNVEV